MSKEHMLEGSDDDMRFTLFCPENSSQTVFTLQENRGCFDVNVPGAHNISFIDKSDNVNLQTTLEALKNITGYLEEGCCSLNSLDYEINKVFNTIERDNPSIMKTLEVYNLPYSVGKVIVKRIIGLTLMHCDNSMSISDTE